MTTQTTNPLPASFTPKQEINLRVNNYMQNKHSILSSALGREDTKAVWYTLLHLEQLMNELRYKEASGLRIYLGAYPSAHELAGQLCLLMVPTRATEQGGHTDIIIDDEPDFTERIGDFDPEEIVEMYKGFNFGSPCPPACGSGALTYPY